MEDSFETELTVGPKAIDAYSRLSYTMWFALAEFVDNSTQSRLNYGDLVDQLLQSEEQPLTVDIIHNRQTKEITIRDNSIGMTRNDLVAALRIAQPTSDSNGRSKYGMGMKTAACWIGAEKFIALVCCRGRVGRPLVRTSCLASIEVLPLWGARLYLHNQLGPRFRSNSARRCRSTSALCAPICRRGQQSGGAILDDGLTGT
jgi:hypothetical protein